MLSLFAKVRAFFSDLGRESPVANIWGAVLNVPQLLGGLVFWDRPGAVIVALVTLLTLIVAAEIHNRDKFSRLTGICHVFWLPLVPFALLWALDPGETAGFRIWAVYIAVTMAFSLLLDIRDVYRWRFTANKHYAFRKEGPEADEASI